MRNYCGTYAHCNQLVIIGRFSDIAQSCKVLSSGVSVWDAYNIFVG